MPELEQTVSPLGGGSGGANAGGIAARPVIDQTFERGGDRGIVQSDSKPVIQQIVRSGGASAGGMKLPDSVRQMLAKMDEPDAAPDPKTESSPAAPGPDVAGAARSAVSPPASSPTGAAAATPTPQAAPASDEHRARADRFEARNRELVAEVERMKSAPRSELDARLKALDEAEKLYLDNPHAAVRKFLAVVRGVEKYDPEHADVSDEMSGLYKDLTARELKVELDQGEVARRESARTRMLLARDRRERDATSKVTAAPTDTPEAQQAAQHTAIIGNRLAMKQDDGKTVGEAYPLTMKLAERLNGMRPEALILAKIRHGVETGEFEAADPNERDPRAIERHNQKLIEQAARAIETQYQALSDAFGQARPQQPQPSTAATPTPPDTKATQDAGRSQVAPSITNASASVAPATPPAKQDAPKEEEQPFHRRRPGESEEKRRLRIAQRHLGG